jgi:hypothetical protein
MVNETIKKKKDRLLGEEVRQDSNIFAGKELHIGPPVPQKKEDFRKQAGDLKKGC